jgi:S1/P1 Nuclease
MTGHQLIASIAQRLLTSKTQQSLSEIVKPTPLDLSMLAPWADRIKHTHAYYWSGTLHYINPIQDFPPRTCSADFSDVQTPERTLLTAIANYTERLNDESLDRWGREEALRFLVHFMGDAEQPLHCTFPTLKIKSVDL